MLPSKGVSNYMVCLYMKSIFPLYRHEQQITLQPEPV